METKICPNDLIRFEPDHGNSVYCCTACYKAFKKRKQRENNALIKKFRKGFLNNYVLFQELLPESGKTNVSVFDLLKNGFDQDGFYGVFIDTNKNKWHRVNEYCFNISKVKEQPILFIYKA
jgi:hypothetical protein